MVSSVLYSVWLALGFLLCPPEDVDFPVWVSDREGEGLSGEGELGHTSSKSPYAPSYSIQL